MDKLLLGKTEYYIFTVLQNDLLRYINSDMQILNDILANKIMRKEIFFVGKC